MRRGLLEPEIRPLESYDGARARSAASLAWAIASGYGGAEHVPEELRDPFYRDQYEQEHLKPPVARLLASSDLYLRAWRHALPPPATPPQHRDPPPADTAALLALLTRRGLPPTYQDAPVREADLRQQPIKMGAHLALIDSLMGAFVAEATRPLAPPPADTDPPPGAWEPRILRWVDTVNRKLQESTERGGAQRPAPPPDGPGHKIRYRKDKVPPRHSPCFPPVLALQDLASGGALAATIHYYCPDALRLDEVCLKEPMSVADSLHNLRLVRDFCQRHLPSRCPLRLEDLLYMAPPLRLNVGVLLAELFLCFEVLRPPIVRPRQLGGGQESPGPEDALTPSSSSPGFNFRHPLLPGGLSPPLLRGTPGSLPHSPSLPHAEGAFGKGWSKKPLSHPLSQAVSFSIPFGLDSDVDIVMGNPLGGGGGTGPLARSASSDSLAAPPHAATNPRRRSAPPPAAAVPPPSPPSIEEALQIIHSSQRLLPDGAPAAFFLHSPLEGGGPQTLGDPPPSTKSPPHATIAAPPGQKTPDPPVRMTSFAERKKQLEEAAAAAVVSTGGGPPLLDPPQELGIIEGGSGGVSGAPPQGCGRGLSAEMSQLGARLEEKRRAIEAQKQRIEAIFAKHRQRLGKSAFLQLQQRGGGPEETPPLPESVGGGPETTTLPENGGDSGARSRKQVTFAEAGYGAAVAQLSTALSCLQQDMQRLSRQQQRLLQQEPPRTPPGQAWVIPPPPKAPPKNSTSASASASATAAAASSSSAAAAAPRESSAPPPQKSPRRPPRPAELRLPPLTRVLTPPRDVDNLPHLRKFSPSQVPVQTRSSIHFSEGEEEEEEEEEEDEEGPPPPASSSPPPPPGSLRAGGAARVSGDGTSDASSPGERRGSLVEVPLGSLGGGDEQEGDSLEGSPTEGGAGPPHRASLGFFFKGEDKAEEAMAQRRAALLERQQRRSEEARQRRHWLEAERRDREEAEARVSADPPRVEEEGGRRGDFTRQEYERRQQLKLMAELDKVLRPRAPPRGPPSRRPPRPKSVFCDDSALARSPAKGLLGARLSKVYSQSTLSLSTVAAEPSAGRAPSRAASPSGPMSPGRAPPPGRDREWENASSASSPASVPEYTGPRLYKEPSAKSNKHIIHNALAHCCLAGRVNEPQKNRVLEEVEKSKANHFLILFRDGGCQFRALYTLGGDPPELSRLAGSGPRTVPLPMVQGIYKYLSDRKRFAPIPAKTMSMSVDAFTIQGHLWQPRKPGTPKKAGTPK